MATGRGSRWATVVVCVGAALAACTEIEVAHGERKRCDRDERRCERGDAHRPRVAAPSQQASGGYADPSRDLGAGSPSCRHALRARERSHCRRSGSVTHRYPINSYGFDVRVGFSLTDMGDSFLGALQNVAALIWMGLVYLMKGVLLLLEWAFSLDRTARGMPEARRTLANLHQRAFGEPWLLAALSVSALWGIWRGLVQRRTTQTLGGLAATVALMVAALVIISQPQATVGEAARLSNDAGTAVLAASRGVDVRQPRAAMAASLADVFDATIRDPWCALEFGSVAWCDAPARPGSRVTNADVWLAYPAQSKERGSLFKLVKGEELDTGDGLLDKIPAPGPVRDVVGLGGDDAELPDEVRELVDEEPERAKLQEAGGTFPRFALLAVIAIGVLGAVSLHGYLAVKLLLASALTLLLLLLTPAMLLAPAFGDSGGATFVAWARRLVGAIAAKLIYAVFLAVVLAAARMFTRLGIGWFGTWLVMAAFWWGVLLKRHEIVGFVSAGTLKSSGRGLGGALSQAYYAMALTRGARHSARAALGSPRRMASEVGRRRGEGRAARAAAVGELAREQLDVSGAHALRGEHQAARERLGHRDDAARELRAVDRRLQGYDEAVAAARARGIDAPKPTREQQALLDHRAGLRSTLDDARVRGAEDVVRHAQRNRAEGHDDVSPRDLAAYRARRRGDLDQLPPNHERNLRAAGVDPEEYEHASPARRAELIGVVQRHMSAERALLQAAEGPSRRKDVRSAEQFLPREELRRRTAEERARLREERRQRRARAGVYRPS
jgi:hypothetical protein